MFTRWHLAHRHSPGAPCSRRRHADRRIACRHSSRTNHLLSTRRSQDMLPARRHLKSHTLPRPCMIRSWCSQALFALAQAKSWAAVPPPILANTCAMSDEELWRWWGGRKHPRKRSRLYLCTSDISHTPRHAKPCQHHAAPPSPQTLQSVFVCTFRCESLIACRQMDPNAASCT